MTIDELRDHISAVVAYNWPSEYQDAMENGPGGHIIENLIALADFIGEPPTASERTALYANAGCDSCGTYDRLPGRTICAACAANQPSEGTEPDASSR